MQNNLYTIVGILVTQKEQTIFTKLIMSTDFNEWSVNKAKRCDGVNVEIEFTTIDCSGLKVGDTVELYYGKGFQGKAKLIGFKKVTKTV